MGIVQWLEGCVTVELVSADPAYVLSALNSNGVSVANVSRIGDLSVRFEIRRKDYRTLKKLAQKKGASVSLLHRRGLYWNLKSLLNRPVIVLGILILITLSVYLPRKVLFIRVEGNSYVPTKLILEKAENCGLYFGADRSLVRSEKIKNGLLGQIEQLQWVGVNTAGCVATVSVRERKDEPEQEEYAGVSSIVAVRDGVIVSCTATSGNILCKTGQAVKAGEVLVSGYTDCGITIQATRAEGEVYARTKRELTVYSPTNSEKRGAIIGTVEKYGLIIGKKRVNFYKDSGISEGSCVKMYEEYYITLPGDLQLPVAIVKETWYTYDAEAISVSQESAQNAMTQFAEDYLKQQMLGGSFLQKDIRLSQEPDVYILRGEYLCLEMIGRVRSEEIIGSNGEDH